jgi:hypothetical protein
MQKLVCGVLFSQTAHRRVEAQDGAESDLQTLLARRGKPPAKFTPFRGSSHAPSLQRDARHWLAAQCFSPTSSLCEESETRPGTRNSPATNGKPKSKTCTQSIHRDPRDCPLPAVGFAAARLLVAQRFLAASRSVSQRRGKAALSVAPRQAHHRASSRLAIRRTGAKGKPLFHGRDFVMDGSARHCQSLHSRRPLYSRRPGSQMAQTQALRRSNEHRMAV